MPRNWIWSTYVRTNWIYMWLQHKFTHTHTFTPKKTSLQARHSTDKRHICHVLASVLMLIVGGVFLLDQLPYVVHKTYAVCTYKHWRLPDAMLGNSSKHCQSPLCVESSVQGSPQFTERRLEGVWGVGRWWSRKVVGRMQETVSLQ